MSLRRLADAGTWTLLRQEPGLQQAQSLVVTPQLREALHLLTLPALELRQYLLQVANENPFIELEEDEEDTLEEGLADKGRDGCDGGVFLVDGWRETAWGREWLLEEDAGPPDVEAPWPRSLYGYLERQLSLLTLPPEEVKRARLILQHLDERGYLVESLETLSHLYGQPVPLLEKALQEVQRLDPPGVGARDLNEAFLLQLRRRKEERQEAIPALAGVLTAGEERVTEEDRVYDVAELLLQEGLQCLVDGTPRRLCTRLGVSLGDLQRALRLLRSLDPHPGRAVVAWREPPPLVPDLMVYRLSDGHWTVSVDTGVVPRVVVDTGYITRTKAGELGEDALQMIRSWVIQAQWLQRALERRRLTLLRIGEALLRLQRDFFERGPEYLVPMGVMDVAHEMGVHPSTVSRTVRDKFIQTRHGLMPVAKLFSPRPYQAGTSAPVTAEWVRRRIREMVEREDLASPLSDQEIQRRLRSQGICLARRTVAKYRRELGIPSQRRRVGGG